MQGKALFLVLLLLIFLPLLFFTHATFLLKTLFTLNFAVLFIITVYYLFKDKKFSPLLASFIVFNFLFFIIAPILQFHQVYTLNNLELPNHLNYKESLMVKTNIFIFIFNSVFYVTYRIFNARKTQIKTYYTDKFLPLHILVFFGVSFLIFVFNFEYIKSEYLEHSYLALQGTTKSAFLLKEKILLMAPFPAFILSVYYIKGAKKRTINYYLIFLFAIFFLVILLLIKNPLTEKRNALGPIYITIIFLLIPKLLNTNFKVLIFLFFSMVIIFPTISLITHSGYSLDKLIKKPELLMYQIKNHGITNTFTTLNYDAFINFSATIEYVEGSSLSYGRQLSGGLFFFVPRKLWTNKPISTGEFIGNYLKDNYGHKKTFTNLSNPFVSEGYINFGLLGIVLFAISLAYFLSIMVNWLNGVDPLKIATGFYASIHMIFFLRGDFTNGFAFLMASFIIMLILPKLYFSLFKLAIKKKPINE